MSAQSSETSGPNLTPILDMVFQLITFFMLVITFKGAALDMSLNLPILGSARPLEWESNREPLMLNVNKAGDVVVNGGPVNLDEHIAAEARFQKARMRMMGEASEGEIPIPVIIRADRSSTFHQVNHVIDVCQRQGFRQFALSALTRGQDSK